jgi:hypothetical protein
VPPYTLAATGIETTWLPCLQWPYFLVPLVTQRTGAVAHGWFAQLTVALGSARVLRDQQAPPPPPLPWQVDAVDLPPPAIMKPIELWTGKQLFSLIVRPNKRCRCVWLGLGLGLGP